MAAAVVPASVVTVHALTPSRSRFLGARIERSRPRARVQRVSMPPFHPCRTGGTVVAEAEYGADSPGAGSSRMPLQKIPPLYVRRNVRSSTVRHPGTIVVMGDVDAESSIIAGGDVFV